MYSQRLLKPLSNLCLKGAFIKLIWAGQLDVHKSNLRGEILD
jgi:hypothetical protein